MSTTSRGFKESRENREALEKIVHDRRARIERAVENLEGVVIERGEIVVRPKPNRSKAGA
jgi:hypothetical protein